MKKDANNKKRFRLFDLSKDGRGISKMRAEEKKGSLRHFFRLLWTNMGKLVSANMFFVLGNFPFLFIILALSGYSKNEAMIPLSDLFQNVFGLMAARPSFTPDMMSLFAMEGLPYLTLVPTALTYVFYGIGALTLFTFGPVNVGTAYILRNLAKGEPVFVWSDFWYAVKRNLRQSLIFGVIDAAVNAILIYNVVSMLQSAGTFLMSLVFWANVVLLLLFFLIRPYMYIQMVTFDLSLYKMLKNALIFSLLGMKRNLMSLLGIVLALVLEMIFLFSAGGFLVPLAVAAPLALLFGMFAFMKVFAAYFKIKQYMIDPYVAEHPEQFPQNEGDGERIMSDDVTERERLAAIRAKNGLPAEDEA